MEGLMHLSMEVQIDGRVDMPVNRQTDGWMMAAWRNGWMEEQTSIQQVSVLDHSRCFHNCHSFNHLKHTVGRLTPVSTVEEEAKTQSGSHFCGEGKILKPKSPSPYSALGRYHMLLAPGFQSKTHHKADAEACS